MFNQIMLSLNLGLLLLIFFCLLFLIFRWKQIVKKVTNSFMQTIFTDNFDENLTELLSGIKRFGGVQTIIENSLRAEGKEVLHRPLGSPKNWPHFDSITFIPAQTTPFPVSATKEVDLRVTIGPNAKKPLQLDIPLLVSGMAYGEGVSEKVKIALAQATTNAGTATNSGEGPFLPEERQAAKNYILQFSKTHWGKEEKELKQADMIEIKLGQGALAGMGDRLPPEKVSGRARKLMNLEEGEDAIINEQFFENQSLNDLKELVADLRLLTGGVPIGAKIMAGGSIEEDIDHLLEIGVDVIAIDGGQAATRGGPIILQDDFGIPTVHAVVRAAQHLHKRGMKGLVSLIISGGLKSPGDYLKVLAFGADAIYLGSTMLYTIAHKQILKPLPWEPPTQIVWYDGKLQDQFDVKKGAEAGANFLQASSEEMKVGLRAMGKTSLKELSTKDLVSYDYYTAKMASIPFSFQSGQQQ